MERWNLEQLLQTDWFLPLLEQVRVAVQRKSVDAPDQRLAIEAEIEQHDNEIRGWSKSLARPDLPHSVRSRIESDMAQAIQRQNELQQAHSGLEAEVQNQRHRVDPQQVVDRLNRLTEVLAVNNPCRTNIELAQHIDSIRCYADGRVTVRICKLGALGSSKDVLSDKAVRNLGNKRDMPGIVAATPRRLGLRKLVGDDVDEEQVRAAAESATHVDRFAGLGPDWFWDDETHLPPPPECWSSANALAVAAKRRETRWTVEKLAVFFGRSMPTIREALKIALTRDPSVAEIPRKMPRSRWVDSHFEEVWKRRCEGWTISRLAEHFARSTALIRQAIALAESHYGKSK